MQHSFEEFGLVGGCATERRDRLPADGVANLGDQGADEPPGMVQMAATSATESTPGAHSAMTAGLGA